MYILILCSTLSCYSWTFDTNVACEIARADILKQALQHEAHIVTSGCYSKE